MIFLGICYVTGKTLSNHKLFVSERPVSQTCFTTFKMAFSWDDFNMFELDKQKVDTKRL